jgi:hypothetical protein
MFSIIAAARNEDNQMKFQVGDRVQSVASPEIKGVVEAVGLSVVAREIVNGHGFEKSQKGVGVRVRWTTNPKRPQVWHENGLTLATESQPAPKPESTATRSGLVPPKQNFNRR